MTSSRVVVPDGNVVVGQAMAIEVTAARGEAGVDAPDLWPVEWDVGAVGLAPEQARSVTLSQSAEMALFFKII